MAPIATNIIRMGLRQPFLSDSAPHIGPTKSRSNVTIKIAADHYAR